MLRHRWPAAIPRLTYGITPPKRRYDPERRARLATRRRDRIRDLPVDALIIYDLQDESSRTDVPRPFPFMEAVDPLDYALDDLGQLDVHRIVYKSVAKADEAGLRAWMDRALEHDVSTVFVGAPSRNATVRLRLADAYRLRQTHAAALRLGGVAIPERHRASGTEDQRLVGKVDAGCSFFVSQAMYDVTAAKDLLSDLWFRCDSQQRVVPPVLITLSPCGSLKTLEFLEWLGVVVPRWLRNELQHSADILDASVAAVVAGFEELHRFATAKGFEIGCNVESVALRQAEIDASVEMVHAIASILKR